MFRAEELAFPHVAIKRDLELVLTISRIPCEEKARRRLALPQLGPQEIVGTLLQSHVPHPPPIVLLNGGHMSVPVRLIEFASKTLTVLRMVQHKISRFADLRVIAGIGRARIGMSGHRDWCQHRKVPSRNTDHRAELRMWGGN